MNNDAMNYIFKKLYFLERENRRLAASITLRTLAGISAGVVALYFKNRKLLILKAKLEKANAEADYWRKKYENADTDCQKE